MTYKNIFTNLTPRELELSRVLKAQIVREINANNGQISFSRYMEVALYDPNFGYYNNSLYKFGTKGDFVTSPTLSKLFARSIAKQIRQLLEYMPVANILEIGAGSGDLMLELLAILDESIEHYYILELSSNLASYQKRKLVEKYPLLASKVIWLNKLPDNFNGLILANEVLDAQPCELINWQKDGIYSCNVGISEDAFVYKNERVSSQLENIAIKLPIANTPHRSEINLNNRGFIKVLAECLALGAILLIDYGYNETEYYAKERNKGTLRGFFRHHLLDDVLTYPGLIDITSSVDFSAIAATAIENQLDHIGYTTQANFLLNCGVLEIMAELHMELVDSEYLILANQLNKLTSPNYMGDIFKVIGFSKNIKFSDWLGFNSGDRSHTL